MSRRADIPVPILKPPVKEIPHETPKAEQAAEASETAPEAEVLNFEDDQALIRWWRMHKRECPVCHQIIRMGIFGHLIKCRRTLNSNSA